MEAKANEVSYQTPPESQTSTHSETTYHLVPNTPTQKQSKQKIPRYLRNASIKLITHPVDKNIAWSFLLSIIFAAISVVTGFPTVVLLLTLLWLALGLRIIFAKCCIPRRRARTTHDSENPRQEAIEGNVEEFVGDADSVTPPSSCLRSENFVRPPESLWLHDSVFNLHIAHSLFFLDPGMSCYTLKDIVRYRILRQTNDSGYRAFPRFLQKIVPVCSGYCWIDDDEFSLEDHIYNEKREIRTHEELQEHISSLMSEPLPLSRPLWEIRLIKDFGKSKDTVLLIRIHQAVSDAITLIRILSKHFSDNQPILKLKTRFGSSTYFLNLFRALFVAPLTFLEWLFLKRRDYNFLNRRHKPQSRVVAWSQNIRFSQVLRVKQIMRCSVNDVLVSAISGAVRAYFSRNGIYNPPNVTLSLPVDLREDNHRMVYPDMGCRFSQVSVRLPCNTEGAIPRLWDVRRRMEELKTSPDTVVMYGAMYCLLPILPEAIAHWILNTVLRKATVLLANVPGPQEELVLGSKRLKKIVFWMSPRSEVPVVFSILSYAGTLQLSVSADKTVVSEPQILIKEFIFELRKLSRLLARRRIPGQHRRRSHLSEGRLAEIISPPDRQLQMKLHSIQQEIHSIIMEVRGKSGREKFGSNSKVLKGVHDTRLLKRIEELKEEFSEVMRELRRRKSLADGIILDNQDEDNDGELRRPRRLTLSSSTSRRASLNTILMSASTTRPLATPTTSHQSCICIASTPNLQIAESPTSAHHRPTFLQVAQDRFGRRKSDFN